MHIVNISLDDSVFSNSGVGDTHKRFVEYAKVCQTFSVVIPVVRPARELTIDSIRYIPAFGKNKLLSYLSLFTILHKVSRSQTLFVANDPVVGLIALLIRGSRSTVKVQINSFGTRVNQIRWIFERPHHWLLWLFSVIAIKGANQIRTDTNRDKQIFVRMLGVSTDKIVVIPVPPSPEIQKKLLAIKRKPLKKVNSVLAIGSLTKNKDFETLLKAFQKVPSKETLKLTIIGSGPEEKNLKNIAVKLNLRNQVNFVPNVTYNQLLSYYAQSDLFVSSSTIEGLPRVLMEACLSALPVVTTNFNGAIDLIEDKKSGRVVPIRNVQKLAEAIESVIENPKTAQKYGLQARLDSLKYLDFTRNLKLLHLSWKGLF